MNYLYFNTAHVNGNEIVKIGISNNPDKRISAFNCGIGHRARGGHCPFTTFSRRYTMRCDNRKEAKKIEKTFKQKNKEFLLSGFGSEVFDMSLQNAHEKLKEAVHAVV